MSIRFELDLKPDVPTAIWMNNCRSGSKTKLQTNHLHLLSCRLSVQPVWKSECIQAWQQIFMEASVKEDGLHGKRRKTTIQDHIVA